MGDKFVRAIFPGSFDPITNGHLDVVRRGIKLFDELVIAVGRSPIKNQLFSPEERVEMIAEGEPAELDRFMAAIDVQMGELINNTTCAEGAASGRYSSFDIAF